MTFNAAQCFMCHLLLPDPLYFQYFHFVNNIDMKILDHTQIYFHFSIEFLEVQLLSQTR